MTNFIHSLQDSLKKGFINSKHVSRSQKYKPTLLINNVERSENVLNTLLEELVTSKSFIISVAFITESGLATLKSHLLDLKAKGVHGRILTSTYLHFNQPKVFKELLKITNVNVRLTTIEGFHAKGYIFDQGTHYSLIVGSSNLTAQALKVNYEWNVKLTSHEDGEIVHHFKHQFEDVWDQSQPLTDEWIEQYKESYDQSVKNEEHQSSMVKMLPIYNVNPIEEALKIRPNKMQIAALQEIQALRNQNKEKGLVVSATGTGKTYLSAFDVRAFAPKRMLFVVHREQILQKAKSDYQMILGGMDKDFGILSGTSRDLEAKYLFATIQTISKQANLELFQEDAFDYILIDEVHKAGAGSYLRVIDYFKPKFLLGMTATPERTDDFNIYELFDYNLAYEIRLQAALEEDMLCPFHYFGVTDIEMNGELIGDTTILSNLFIKERVDHFIEKVEYYGHSGEKVRGLVFCSRKEEAKQLSQALNNRGYKTVALTGEASQEERDRQINRLENGYLDYIITVDIFNEGIDIPSVNQIVMLRQTESSIIFIQQLGRGLRKHPLKEFVTVIDFIGNYKNNYLIPIALSGDRSQNKDYIRRHMKDTGYIKGVSTINFEEVAKNQIFKAISHTNLTALKELREAYIALKNKIGSIPYLSSYIEHYSIDPIVVVEKYQNYYQFLLKMKEEIPTLLEYEIKVLTMLSLEILNGKRVHEIYLIEQLLKNNQVCKQEFLNYLIDAKCLVDEPVIQSMERILNLSFYTENQMKKYGREPIIYLEDSYYRWNSNINKSLEENPFFAFLVEDVIKVAKEKSKEYDVNETLTLFKKYTRKDACRLLKWGKDESSTMYGYKTKHKTCPIFITYHKHEEVESSVKYEDELLSPDLLQWYTRSNRKIESNEVQTIIRAEELGIDLHIFIKKDDDEGTDFYYIGKAKPVSHTVKQEEMEDAKGKRLPVVAMHLALMHEVEHKLYEYLVTESI